MTSVPVTFITGSSRGIGRYLVEHYLAQGHQVIGCSRADSDVKNERYEHFHCDVARESELIQVFSTIRGKHGRLDHLINNAGIAATNHAMLIPAKTAQRILDVNVMGNLFASREAARLMQQRKFGRIVNFSTIAVAHKIAGEAMYAASKAAVVTLTQVLSKEFAPYSITVNAVGPTPIQTDILKSLPQAKLDAVISRQAIRRFGEFRDVSNVVDFFLRPESDYVTGQVLYLGGVS
jgi:3-oxoacyl-[acyl-carrier protein] reductase